MPNPEQGHYDEEILNHGYIYTNLSDIEIKEDMAKSYVTIYTSHRIDDYRDIKLPSVYRKRHREKTRLSPLFIELFLDESKKYELDKKIQIKGQKIELSFISDFEAEGVDELAGKDIEAQTKVDIQSEVDLQRLYDFFVRRNLAPFYPEDRTIGRVKEAIYYFFRMKLGMQYTQKFAEIINIVLSEENKQHFMNVLDATKERYIAETQKRDLELETVEAWEVPRLLNFSGEYTKFDSEKSVLQPFYYDNRWKTEEAFIKLLEKSKNIDWWFKNGERDSTFFAVSYEENGEDKPFYVDFIVQFKDGRIGLFDTKSGRTIKDAREKSDGLQKYLKEGKNLYGGIVTNTDPQNFSGRWMVYSGIGSDLAPDDFTNWDLLDV